MGIGSADRADICPR